MNELDEVRQPGLRRTYTPLRHLFQGQIHAITILPSLLSAKGRFTPLLRGFPPPSSPDAGSLSTTAYCAFAALQTKLVGNPGSDPQYANL